MYQINETLVSGRKHTIALSGYVSDISRKLDEALSIYMVCSHDQSYCWGDIPSLSKAIQKAGVSVPSLSNYINQDLEKILKDKFDSVKVSVQINSDSVFVNQIKLNIEIELVDGNYKDRVVNILEIQDGKFNRLIKLHNGV